MDREGVREIDIEWDLAIYSGGDSRIANAMRTHCVRNREMAFSRIG